MATDGVRGESERKDMSYDIVARIREQANAGYIDEHEVMLREAADEIERLREQVTTWKELAYKMHNWRGWLMPKRIRREFDRAHYSDWTPQYKREFNKWLEDMNKRLEATREP
jgi:hypothetical protein